MPSRSNPATKLFHAIVLFGVALTGGACSDDSDKNDKGQSGGTGGSDAGAQDSGGGDDASPWW